VTGTRYHSILGYVDDGSLRAGVSGAFALPLGSQDAALVATLAAGNYSVQVSGLGTTTGIAIVEIYEMP
jgi:hypothetical protein